MTKTFIMIGVAAKKSGLHPQTLRIYENRGLIKPYRTEGNTRLYSEEDIRILKRIQYLATKYGMNLAGIARVLYLEQENEKLKQEIKLLKNTLESSKG